MVGGARKAVAVGVAVAVACSVQQHLNVVPEPWHAAPVAAAAASMMMAPAAFSDEFGDAAKKLLMDFDQGVQQDATEMMKNP
eukprot:Skav229769  [mRNA]  locus=scaffold4146:6272:6517:+ [translate_table: standard]